MSVNLKRKVPYLPLYAIVSDFGLYIPPPPRNISVISQQNGQKFAKLVFAESFLDGVAKL